MEKQTEPELLDFGNGNLLSAIPGLFAW